MATAPIILNYDLQPSAQAQSKLQAQMATLERNLKLNGPFSGMAKSTQDFNYQLDRATQRVITLGTAFGILSASNRILQSIVTNTIAIDKAMVNLNAIFKLTNDNVKALTSNLFDLSREAATPFLETAKAAEEFARQGLSANKVLEATRAALILSRDAGIDVTDSVKALTAATNSFSKEALGYIQIANRIATVDTSFAVSSKDLQEALIRTGSAASDAGLNFNQFIGIVTSAQQISQRGGAVISQALNTIFTRVGRKDTLDALEGLGVAITDLQGQTLPTISILQNFAKAYDGMTGSIKNQAAELVGGVRNLNTLKATLKDLSRENSVFAQSQQLVANSSNQAEARNAARNQSLAAQLEQLKLNGQQVGANIGNVGFNNNTSARGVVSLLNNNPIIDALKDSDKAETTGGQFAQFFIKGFGGAVIFGLTPLLVSIFANLSKKVFSNLAGDLVAATSMTNVQKDQAAIESQIVNLYKAGGTALEQQLATMTSLTERAALLKGLLSAGQQGPSLGPIVSAIYQTGYRAKRAAGGYIPMGEESAAIAAGVGGAPLGAKPVYLPDMNLVANTSEFRTPGGAVYNRNMIRQGGLPPGSVPIAAGGYIPNMAGGGLDPEYGKASYYKWTPAAVQAQKAAEEQAQKEAAMRIAGFEKSKKLFEQQEALEAKNLAARERAIARVEAQYDKEQALAAKRAALSEKQLEAVDKAVNVYQQKERSQREDDNIAANFAHAQRKSVAAAQIIGGPRDVTELRPVLMGARSPYNRNPDGSLDKFDDELTASQALLANRLRNPLGRTRAESFYKRDFQNLRLGDLEAASGLGLGAGVSPNFEDRYDAGQIARTGAVGRVVGPKGVNYNQLNDALTASRGLANGQTLQEQFNTTVKELLNSGKGMNTAYNAAIDQIMGETDNRKQINKIIRNSIPAHVAYEKDLAESKILTAASNKQLQASIDRRAVSNAANARLSAGDTFASLTASQRSSVINDLRSKAIDKLGFSGMGSTADILKNPTARAQVNAEIAPYLAALKNGTASQMPGSPLAKAGLLSRINTKLNTPAYALGLGIGLPILGSNINEGVGGTLSGQARGAASFGLNVAGFGATAGSLFGPLGAGGGALIGGALGGLYGWITKATKSFEEMATEIDQANKKREEQKTNALEVLNYQDEIGIARDNGDQQRVNELKRARTIALSKVKDKGYLQAITNQGTDEARDTITKDASTKSLADNLRDSLRLGLATGASNTPGAKFSSFMNGLLPFLPGGPAVSVPVFGQRSSKEVDTASQSVESVLSLFSRGQISDLQKQNEKNPQKVLEIIARTAGLQGKDLKDTLAGSGGFSQAAVTIALKNAASQDPAIAAKLDDSSTNELIRSRGLLSRAAGFHKSGAFGGITSSADRQIEQIRQQIASQNPTLTDVERLQQSGIFGSQNIREQIAGERSSTLNAGKGNLLQSISGLKGVGADVEGRITGLGSATDIRALLKDLSIENGSGARKGLEGVSGENSPIKKALEDLAIQMESLDKTQTENTRANEESNKLLMEQLRERRTLGGALKESIGDINQSSLDFAGSVDRNDPRAVQEANAYKMLRARLDVQRRLKVITEGQAESTDLGFSLTQSSNADQRRRDAILSQAAAGNSLISGSDISSARFGNAQKTGQSGDSKGSLIGGFQSVFAGLKRDMADFSDVGQQAAQTLTNSFTNAFGEFVTGAKKGKDAFRDFATSVLSDASRMLAAKAITGIIASIPGFGVATGGSLGLAAGGMVPAMLTGGEYVFGPKAAHNIGYDTLRRLNGYAEGGFVQGGSGVRDDVPAKLPTGSFVIRKAAAQRLGGDYLSALAAGQVQHRAGGGALGGFGGGFGLWGALIGAVVGGGLGYLSGGKKGAIGGALLGAVGGGLYQGSTTTVPAGTVNGVTSLGGTAAATLSVGEKGLLGLGAAAGLGLLAGGIGASKSTPGPISIDQIPAYKKQLEAQQASSMAAHPGQFPYLQIGPQGQNYIAGFGDAPATRRWATGGGVDIPMITSHSFPEKGDASSIAARGFTLGGGVDTPMTTWRGFSGGGGVDMPAMISRGFDTGGGVDAPMITGPSSNTSGGSSGAAQVNIKVEINNNGASSSATSNGGNGQPFGPEFADKLNRQIRGVVQDELVQQSRSDGFLTQKSRFVNRS